MKGQCYYCERPFGFPASGKGTPLLRSKDHIIPISRGGVSRPRNYVYCCIRCNGLKADRTPDQFAIHLGACLDKLHFPISKNTLRLILTNTEKLLIEIAPYRDTLTKLKLTKEEEQHLPQIPGPPKVKIQKLPPEKVLPVLAEQWQREFLKRYNKEPEPNFHEQSE